MSEHQCYEFVALDRPLTSKQMAELRAISTRAETKSARAAGRRTVAELRASAEKHRGLRERAEAERAAKARRAAEAARKKRLDGLAKRLDAAWTELEALVEMSAYEEAIKLASGLRDLAKRDGASVPFAAPFEAMRKRQLREERLETIYARHFVWPGKAPFHPPREKSDAGG